MSFHTYLYFETTRSHACGGRGERYFSVPCKERLYTYYCVIVYPWPFATFRVRLHARISAHGISWGLSACVDCVTQRRYARIHVRTRVALIDADRNSHLFSTLEINACLPACLPACSADGRNDSAFCNENTPERLPRTQRTFLLES